MQSTNPALILTPLGHSPHPSYLLGKTYCSSVKRRKQTGIEPAMVTLSPIQRLGTLLTWSYNFFIFFLTLASQSICVCGKKGQWLCLKLGTTPLKRLKEKWSSFGQYLPHVDSQRKFRGEWDCCVWQGLMPLCVC